MSEKKKISFVWLVVLIVGIIVLVVCAVIIAQQFFDTGISENERDSFTVTTQPQQSLPANPIDFEKLQQVNTDVYAWIKIDNTKVNYPIAQAYVEPDSYYLDHNYKKEYDKLGCIFTEKQNARDFSDPNTLVYGHNTWSGEMFYTLYNFKDESFFNKNKFIYIYTPGHILTYTVYAAYEYDNRHILNSFDFSNDQVFYNYLQTTLNPSSLIRNVRDGVKLERTDKIITLCTCMKNVPNSRYLVQGVLTDDQQTR